MTQQAEQNYEQFPVEFEYEFKENRPEKSNEFTTPHVIKISIKDAKQKEKESHTVQY